MNLCITIVILSKNSKKKKVRVHPPGIEPGSPAWQAEILPLDHGCLSAQNLHQMPFFVKISHTGKPMFPFFAFFFFFENCNTH